MHAAHEDVKMSHMEYVARKDHISRVRRSHVRGAVSQRRCGLPFLASFAADGDTQRLLSVHAATSNILLLLLLRLKSLLSVEILAARALPVAAPLLLL